MDSRATQQCNMFPYVFAVYWPSPASSAFLLARKCNWLAERMLITCVARHARTHKLQLSGPTVTDLNYWIKLLSCIIEANGGHIGLSHINLHWYYWGSRRGFYRFRLLVGMDKHCVNEISFTNNFCFFLNLPVNNELGIVQDGRHEFIIKCFKPSQNH